MAQKDQEAYRESVPMLAVGCKSAPWVSLPSSKSHISSFVSLEKSASTAPALVPVAMHAVLTFADHAKAAVRVISRRPPMVDMDNEAEVIPELRSP